MRIPRQRYDWLWLVIIAALPRFINLGSENLWYDETFTAWMVKLDLGNMMRAIQGDVHPPLWYLITWLDVRLLGSSEWALRLPTTFLGVGAVILIWLIARQAGLNRVTAFVAGVLVAVLPSAIYYSQEARMYALLECAVLGLILAAMRRNWIVYVVCGVVAAYSQNLGLVYVAAVGVAAWLVAMNVSWQMVNTVIRANVVILLCWLPWLPSLLHQMHAVSAGFWIQSFTAGAGIYGLLFDTMYVRVPPATIPVLFSFIIVLSLVALWESRRWLGPQPLVAAGLVVPLIVILISVTWRSVFLPRAFMPTALLLMIPWSYALTRPGLRLLRLAVVPVLVVCLVSYYLPSELGRYPIKRFLAPIQEQWQPGDVVYNIANDAQIQTGYYLPGRPLVLMPETTDLNQSLSGETKVAMGFVQTNFDHLPGQYRRAWVITTFNPLSSQAEMDEVARIQALYHCKLVAHDGSSVAHEEIYLVDLREF